jgi:hypothetical protein
MFPNVALWQSLLGACKTYGNVERVEIASQKLVEMGSNSCGDFVLLSNVYAAHERWNDVGRVREAMKNRDVKKIPGFSYIEVDGVIHKFVNGDLSHSNWHDIYAKLDEIKFRIKAYGYVAETNFLLHDIGQEDKENVLCYHSEKLVVAFGLISTSEGDRIVRATSSSSARSTRSHARSRQDGGEEHVYGFRGDVVRGQSTMKVKQIYCDVQWHFRNIVVLYH